MTIRTAAQQIAGQSFVITGWAVTNEVGVAKVEISTDGGGDLESVPDFQQSESVAGVGVLALRVGKSAEREARNSSARDGRERQIADVFAVGRMAGRRDGVSHGYCKCGVNRHIVTRVS